MTWGGAWTGGRVLRWVTAGWLLTGGLLTDLLAAPAPADPRRDVVVEVVERLLPAVVNIATEEIVEYRDPFADLFREFWGPHYRNRPRSTRYSVGSGVVIDEEGHILTNLHVVQRATRIWVQFLDGREVEATPVVGTARTDVALLKIQAKPGDTLEPVRFAKDEDLMLGETVLALGNPFGLGGSVSRGILSSKNRRPPIESERLDVADWLQTDAAINPGSSGGPLVNLRGELIGLNVAVYREGQGIGFAIPIKQVAEALSEIVTPEVQRSTWFGARFRAGPAPVAVVSVAAGSPAAQAGLRVGDVVQQVDGKAPRNFIDVVDLLAATSRETALTVLRAGERRVVKVQLRPLADLVRERTGLTLQELTAELAEPLGLRARQGLLVADVEAGSPAARARLQPGQLVLGVAGQATADLRSAVEALDKKAAGERVELTLLAQQQRGFITQVGQVQVALTLR